MTVEAVRMILEAMRVIKAIRKIIEAVRLFVEAVRVLVEAVRVLQSLANNSIPINPRLRNHFLHSQFDPVKFRAIVRFASIEFGVGVNHIVFSSILQRFGLNQYVFVRSCIDFYSVCSFCFDTTRP